MQINMRNDLKDLKDLIKIEKTYLIYGNNGKIENNENMKDMVGKALGKHAIILYTVNITKVGIETKTPKTEARY